MVAGFKSSTSDEIALIVGRSQTVSRQVVLAAGQNRQRGTLLGQVTASQAYVISVSASIDGSEQPVGILAQDCDATAADRPTTVYFKGTFNEDALIYGAGHTTASVRERLRDVGIDLQRQQAW